jgi:Large eukaryotic DNA virus major capsid protein/Major capsid protein N-terminus
MELNNVLRLERRVQASVFNLFRKVPDIQNELVAALNKNVAPTPPPSTSPAPAAPIALYPIDVNGFYRVTGPTQVTFYVTSDRPLIPLTAGWTGDGFTGILGQIQIIGFSNVSGSNDYGAYNWSFILQTDTDQNIQGTQSVTGAILYPPSLLRYRSKQIQTPIYGYYTTDLKGITTFYFSAPPPPQMTVDWIITGLPTFSVPLRITSYTAGPLQPYATLVPTDGSVPPLNLTPIFVNGVPSMVQEPLFTNTFVPGKFTNYQSPDLNIPNVAVNINSNIKLGSYASQRDLNTDTAWSDVPPGNRLFPENPYRETKSKGFSSGSVLALQATGPHEKYLLTDDMSKSQWNPDYKRYSNFVMYQKVYPFPPPNPVYQGQTVQIELRPTEMGHLLSNMYLSVNLPALAAGLGYTTNVGRALLKQVDLLVNETIVETLYDDWYVIRDQVFLDADEQLGLQTALNVSNAQVGGTLTIPLEFFFCRRHTHNNKDRERLRKPYFPTCAMWNQRLYVRFTFQPNTWWASLPAGSKVDIYPSGTTQWPVLITEEILLENAEKLHYQHTPQKYIVNRVQKESALFFNSPNPILQLTANYPVQVLAWFFRNKNYEIVSDGRYYNSRYSYGYTTQYIRTGVELQFPSGNSNYVDVINNAKITLNNVDILSTFQGSLYYSFKQPMEHSLSIPSKNIYLYSFGLTPREYNQGGYLNFSKLNSQTTYIQLNFNQSYANQIIGGYNLYLFYYGYSLLQFQGGFASLPFL